jgi:ABC-type branched-subunit amino acid transport system ATPase component
MSSAAPVLTLRHVRVRFGGLRALDLDELVIPGSGGVAAVFIGPNGAGKTTLLNAITGYARVAAGGTIRLHGEPNLELSALSRDAIVRAGVARTFQTPLLFGSLTVRESVLLAARFGTRRSWRGRLASLVHPPGRGHAEAALSAALLEALELKGVAETRMGKLSLPLLRRAELARCLAAQPRLVMMLDEPTAGADDAEREALVQFLSERLAVVVAALYGVGLYRFPVVTAGVVTHDLELMRQLAKAGVSAPEVYVLSRGSLFTSGPLDQVVSDPRVQELYLGRI